MGFVVLLLQVFLQFLSSGSLIGFLVVSIASVAIGIVSCASLNGDIGNVLTNCGPGAVCAGIVLGVVSMGAKEVGVSKMGTCVVVCV